MASRQIDQKTIFVDRLLISYDDLQHIIENIDTCPNFTVSSVTLTKYGNRIVDQLIIHQRNQCDSSFENVCDTLTAKYPGAIIIPQ